MANCLPNWTFLFLLLYSYNILNLLRILVFIMKYIEKNDYFYTISISKFSVYHSNFLTLVYLRLGNKVGGNVLQFNSGVGSLSIIYLTFLSNSGVHFLATSKHPKFSSNCFTLVAPRRQVLVSELTIAHASAS